MDLLYQSQADQDQNAALQAVAKMTEGQRTYYQTNGKFRAVVNTGVGTAWPGSNDEETIAKTLELLRNCN